MIKIVAGQGPRPPHLPIYCSFYDALCAWYSRPLWDEAGWLFPALSEELLHQAAPWPTAPMQSGNIYIPGGLKSSACTVAASRPWWLIIWSSAKSSQKMACRLTSGLAWAPLRCTWALGTEMSFFQAQTGTITWSWGKGGGGQLSPSDSGLGFLF